MSQAPEVIDQQGNVVRIESLRFVYGCLELCTLHDSPDEAWGFLEYCEDHFAAASVGVFVNGEPTAPQLNLAPGYSRAELLKLYREATGNRMPLQRQLRELGVADA